jgi:hypothetical protein
MAHQVACRAQQYFPATLGPCGGRSASRLAQGREFPNLSCLGLLSDRVLSRDVAVTDARALASQNRELARIQWPGLGAGRTISPALGLLAYLYQAS